MRRRCGRGRRELSGPVISIGIGILIVLCCPTHIVLVLTALAFILLGLLLLRC